MHEHQWGLNFEDTINYEFFIGSKPIIFRLEDLIFYIFENKNPWGEVMCNDFNKTRLSSLSNWLLIGCSTSLNISFSFLIANFFPFHTARDGTPNLPLKFRILVLDQRFENRSNTFFKFLKNSCWFIVFDRLERRQKYINEKNTWKNFETEFSTFLFGVW